MSSAYLLIGKERLAKKEFLLDLRQKNFKDPSAQAMNSQEWDAADDGALGAFLDFAQTAPFLAEKRMAVLWQVEELEAEDQKRLLSFLKNPPAAVVLVFSSDETGTKKRKILQELEAAVTLITCHTPFDKDLPAWIETRARRFGGTIARDAARALAEKAGKDTQLLSNALEQLLLFAHPRTAVTTADVEALMGKYAEEDIFTIAEEIFAKNTKGALEKTEQLMNEGVRAPEIIGVLAGQFERMKQAADMLERGASPAEVASAMRVHSFFQAKFFLQLKKISKRGVQQAQKRLLDCDTAFKQGRLGEKIALEKFILEG